MPTPSSVIRRKISFDPTINLGHIITMVTALGVGIAGWYNLQQRVTVLEDARVMQKSLYGARVASVDKRMDELTIDVRDIRLLIERDRRQK